LTVYLETSFLVSLYSVDANSAAAIAAMRSVAAPFPLTSFCELEVTNALQLRVFRREITPSEAKLSLADLAADLRSGVFHSVPTPASVYEEALRLARRHTAVIGTRPLDILHVAAAITLGVRTLYTFDRRQAQLARAAGLKTPIRVP
jgi:predicted nucleic acid-binding protein